ncbi:MAG: hypothetical protein ACR2JE_03025 [Acidobacteriaceae bacterium]
MLIVDVKQFVTQADGSRAYVWRTVRAEEALKLAEPRLRCSECKGAVGLFRASADGAKPNRVEHKKKNPGCSLGDCFDGKPRLAMLPVCPEEESVHAEGMHV